MGSRLLMADIDDADSLLGTTVEDRDDVTTGKGENGVNALSSQRPGDDLSPVNLCHARTLFE